MGTPAPAFENFRHERKLGGGNGGEERGMKNGEREAREDRSRVCQQETDGKEEIV